MAGAGDQRAGLAQPPAVASQPARHARADVSVAVVVSVVPVRLEQLRHLHRPLHDAGRIAVGSAVADQPPLRPGRFRIAGATRLLPALYRTAHCSIAKGTATDLPQKSPA